MRYLGIHASAGGGLENAIKLGNQAGVNAIQTMLSAPMRWSLKEIAQDQIDNMAKEQAKSESSVKKILFHGVYLTNLARQDQQKFHFSKVSQQTHLDAAQRLQQAIVQNGGDGEVLGVIFHPGSALDCTPEEGIKRISQGLDWILEQTPGDGMLLLETSAGAGNVMGDTLEELSAMREGVLAQNRHRVGFVLDTQHMFVSGYDWINNLEDVVAKVEKFLSFELVKAIHLNDSMQPYASHKDRHENLGKGKIGEQAIKAIVNHPKLKSIPFILETPAMKSVEEIAQEVAVLKSYAE